MMGNNGSYAKLKTCAFGFALGFTNGLGMALFAWAGWLGKYGIDMIHQIASVYYGYAPTLVGGLIGGAWGFLNGFIFGMIVACVYNLCLCCCCKKSASCDVK